MAEPLALYVHWPFCVSKCPYCDFNSHVRGSVDQAVWRDALLADGFHSTVTAVPYEFQQGGNEMLVLSHTPIR